jgi:hypothetical protein
MGFIMTYWSNPTQNPLIDHINVSQLQVWLYKVKVPGVSNDPDDICTAENSFHTDSADCPRIIRCACLSAASFVAKNMSLFPVENWESIATKEEG